MSKKTLNEKNLEALGAPTLARLLMDLAEGDAALKRRLRVELAGAQGPDEVAKEVRKRLTSIGRAQSFVEWKKTRRLAADLDDQRQAITDKILPQDHLIEELAPALGSEGLEHLRQRVAALAETPVPVPPDEERETVGWGPRGPIYADEIARTGRRMMVKQALQEIADLQGDMDAHIA